MAEYKFFTDDEKLFIKDTYLSGSGVVQIARAFHHCPRTVSRILKELNVDVISGPRPKIITHRKCSDCREIKLLEEFTKRKNRGNGYGHVCLQCNRMRHRIDSIAKYGITPEEYNNLLKLQNGVCAICKKSVEATEEKYRRLNIDHCHITGKVRGLLCHNCNRGIGYLKDNIDSLSNAIDYLQNNPYDKL